MLNQISFLNKNHVISSDTGIGSYSEKGQWLLKQLSGRRLQKLKSMNISSQTYTPL